MFVTKARENEIKMQTYIGGDIDYKHMPNSKNNPQDTATIQNIRSFPTSTMLRSNESFVKAVTESLSSGFCSNTDTIELDYDIFKLFTNLPTSVKIEGYNNKNSINEVQTIQQDISSSSLMNSSNFILPANSNNEAIRISESNECNWLNDNLCIKKPPDVLQNCNIGENDFNLNDFFALNTFQLDLASNDNTQQMMNLNNDCFFGQSLNDNKNIVDPTLQMWNQPNDQFMNSLNLTNIQNFDDINIGSSQNYFQDQEHGVNLINEELLNGCNTFEACSVDVKNLQTVIQDCSAYVQGINLQNFNNSIQNQNIIVRVVPNGQLQLTNIDPNNFQQNGMSNNHQNTSNGGFSYHDLNNRQISVQNLINNSAMYYNGDARKVGGLFKKNEPIDLMENPSNWRRMPNNAGYQCNLCNKSYTRKYGLKIHLRIHSGFKPLECKVCQKKFGDPSNMAKHIRLHSSDGSPYKCTLCDKPLVRRRDLERHMRSRHPDISPKHQNMEQKRII